MKTDIQKTQHYTTNYEKICHGLLEDFQSTFLVEPFVGGGDLLNLFPNANWEVYDIDENLECEHRDTLLNPPNYIGKYVITNPPFLAKNHATDKTLFYRYGYDDLYKIFLKTIIGCDGGLVIVPGNFFCDEGSISIRKEFLSKYRVKRVNFFTYPVFETTSYSVCAFDFFREDNCTQNIPFYINGTDIPIYIELDDEYNYQVAGKILTAIAAEKPIFSRLINGKEPKNPTNIYLYAADTKDKRIRLEYKEEPYYGKNTDRMFATLDCEKQLTEQEQKQLIQKTNEWLTNFREKYANLPFTNYRDNNRKRVGFDFIYRLCSLLMKEKRDVRL